MSKETVKIEYQETIIKPSFGGQRIMPVYIMTHWKYSRVNKYKITCEITGIQDHSLTLRPYDSEFMGNMEAESNDETLTSQAAMDLFDDNVN